MPSEFHTVYDWATGTTWVADGSENIARLEPPRLRDLKFKPDGDPIGTWLTLFWWQYVNNEGPGRSAWITDEIKLDDHNPERYRLTLRSHNSDRSVESLCTLDITYKPDKSSYVYDVHMLLTVQPEQEWVINPGGGVEFANPWFIDAVGSSTEYLGSQSPRWTWVVYSSPTGKILRLPLNHLGAPSLEQIRFPASGGWLGFFNHPDGNPVIELAEETAENTRGEVCAWGYDSHFIHQIKPDTNKPLDASPSWPTILKSGQKLSAHYLLYCLPPEQSQVIFDRAEQLPLDNASIHDLIRPAYVYPINTFQKSVSPDKPDCAWYWTSSPNDGLSWEKDFGHSGNASLAIHNPTPRIARWQAAIGPDFWMQPLSTERQKLSCWIRTNQVKGKGATISFRYSNYEIETGQKPAFSGTYTKPITDSQDWTPLEIELEGPPVGATRAYIELNLDGTGKAWFDEVALLPLG